MFDIYHATSSCHEKGEKEGKGIDANNKSFTDFSF